MPGNIYVNRIQRDQFVKTLNEQLQMQTREWLIDRLCEFAVDDGINADRIPLYLSAEKDNEDEVIKDFKVIIDKAIKQVTTHGSADWRNKLPSRALWDVAESLAKVSRYDKEKAVLEIAEYALLGVDSISGLQDECELDGVIGVFRDLHISACHKLKLDPAHFGTHLAQLANKTDWWLFEPKEYAEFLGEPGLASYVSARMKKAIQSL